MPSARAERLIAALNLAPLPWEGGYYRETWRAAETIPKDALPAAYSGPRAAGTAIYYLLTDDTVSRLHRLPPTETFHFYLGAPVELLLLREAPHAETVILGPDLEAGHQVQMIVPGGTWMGARLRPGGDADFALMGTTVSPGFDFDDLEMADGAALRALYPAAGDLIAALS